jgi:methylenetetrahydrofolate dehydrogenase (NADP+) / methenyltetrahydrofolate cyclohydrolase
MKILDGKALSLIRAENLRLRAKEFHKQKGRSAHLKVILVGKDPASAVYVKNKILACQSVGIHSTQATFAEGTSKEAFASELMQIQSDENIDAVLVQLPVPPPLTEEWVQNQLHPSKDADALSFESLGRLMAGRSWVKSCTPQGIIELLKHYQIALAGKHCVVVGRSLIVGKPVAQLLVQENATVTLCHSQSRDTKAQVKSADVVVVAAGKPGLFGSEDFKTGATLIDVGIHRQTPDGKLCGDVRWDGLDKVLAAATPVPGGVGPMTISCLLENTLILAERRMKGF